MIIARIGNFALRTKCYVSEHEYTTHDIEIVCYEKVDKTNYSNPETAPDEHCYSIASFDDETQDVISYGNRLIDATHEAEDVEEAVKAVKILVDMGLAIIDTENCASGHTPNHEIRSWRLNTETNLLDEI